MPPPEASRALYRRLQRLQLILVLAGRRAWGRMDPDDFDGSWRQLAPALVAVTAAAQLAAARAATEYVPAVLAETGQPDDPLAQVRPEAFAGQASDGRSLVGLLTGAVVFTKLAMRSRAVEDDDGTVITIPGLPAGEALLRGQGWLDQVLRTTATDAARDATKAEIAVREDMGWVRMINPPCCSRCAALAGKWFSWKADFDRHPGCDCTAIPARENLAGDFTTDARQLVDRGLITDLTDEQRQRLDAGDGLSRVLNETRDGWRERMAADRRARGPVDRLGRSRPTGWAGGGTNPPPVGTTIHQLFDKLRADVDRANVTQAMRAAGIAA